MERLNEIIAAIKKPLVFASRNKFSNLENIKELELYVDTLANEALTLSLDHKAKVIFQNVIGQFNKFDSLDYKNKKDRIEKTLDVLTGRIRDLSFFYPPERKKRTHMDLTKFLQSESSADKDL